MATFVATIDLTLRDAPSFSGSRIGTVPKDAKVEGIPSADPLWFRVTRSGPLGYLPFAYLRAENPAVSAMDDSDRDRFCTIVTAAARDHAVDPDYLMALAFVESSGINNDKATDTQAFGPFRFLPATWDRLVEKYGAANSINSEMLFQWWEQPAFAAILTEMNTVVLKAAFGRTPTLQELYFAHVFGSDVAGKLLTTGTLATNFAAALQAAFPGRPPGPLAADDAGHERTVQEVLEAMGKRLQQGLAGAAPIIERQEPDVRDLRIDPPRIGGDDAPANEIEQTFTTLIKLREGVRRKVYLDSRQKPTVGIGHLIVPPDNLKVGDVISDARVSAFFKVDGGEALKAAKSQAGDAGISSAQFIAYLASVNFQLGTEWRANFPNTWKMISKGQYREAAEALNATLWQAQTPVRVADFQEALRRL